MTSSKRLLRAAWVAPMHQPLIRDGGVVFEETRIIAVGSDDDLRQQHPDAHSEDLGDAIILPGLINAHTHLELSVCHVDPSGPASFVEWLLGIREQLKATQLEEKLRVQRAVELGVEQCLRFGVTCVGDISQNSHVSRPTLAQSPLRCVSYGEVLGLGGLRDQFERLLERAVDQSSAAERVRVGLTPHSPYTVDLERYHQCLQLAKERALPLATHLAETSDERIFLEEHAGPLRELWDRLGLWREDVRTYRGGPIAFAHAIGLLDLPALLAHVNYCDDRELATLASGSASVVYCPRTHAYFGHPPHRWQEMLNEGINVAVGTDSCASSPDLNLVEELRLLRRISPDVAVELLWEMATTRAARAINMEDVIGCLAPGKAADFVAFPVTSRAPLVEILQADAMPAGVWIGGQRAV